MLTKKTDSRAAMAKMSAQETIPLHELSTAVLIASTTSNPLTELVFGKAVFSPPLPSNKIDASQPYILEGFVSMYNHIQRRLTPFTGKVQIEKITQQNYHPKYTISQ